LALLSELNKQANQMSEMTSLVTRRESSPTRDDHAQAFLKTFAEAVAPVAGQIAEDIVRNNDDELKRLKEENKKLKADLDACAASKKELSTEIDKLKAAHAEVVNVLIRTHEEEVKLLKEENAMLRKQLADIVAKQQQTQTELKAFKKQLADADAKHKNERAMQVEIADVLALLRYRMAYEYNQQPGVKGVKEVKFLGDVNDAVAIRAFAVTLGFTADEWDEIVDFKDGRDQDSHHPALRPIYEAARKSTQKKAVLLPPAEGAHAAITAATYLQGRDVDVVNAVSKAIAFIQK